MNTSSNMLIACTYICLLGVSLGANATNYFHWDVESDNFYACCNSSYDHIDGWHGNAYYSTKEAHAGNQSYRIVAPGNSHDGGTMAPEFNFTGSNKLDRYFVGGGDYYYRWWMMIEPGFSFGDRSWGWKFARATGWNGERLYTLFVRYDGFYFAECDGTGGCLNSDGTPNSGDQDMRAYAPLDSLDDGQWHEYIIKIHPNSTPTTKDAAMTAYVDGVKTGEISSILMHAHASTKLFDIWYGPMMYPYFQISGGSSVAGYIYVDDISVDDTYNSLLVGGDTTPPPTGGDTTLPIISSIAPSNVSQTSATITATTNEAADFQVEYGLTTSYGESTTLDTRMVTDHAVTLAGLVANTTYHYRARSTDAAGNLAISGDKTFSTNTTVISDSGSSDECSGWQTTHPEWIWCDNFESADISVGQGQYFEYDNNSGDFVPLSGVGWNDSYGMRAKWQAGEVGAGNLKVVFGHNPIGDRGIRSAEDFRELYYRVYVKTQAGWTGDPGKLSRTTVFSKSDWSQAMIAHLWSPDSGGNTLAIDPVSCVSGSSVTCSGYNDFNNMQWLGLKNGVTQLFSAANANKWYCVESHVKLNDPGQSNGIQEFWVNGQLEARSSNLDFVGSYADYGLNAVFLENHWNAGSPQVQERYLDNFVVSTQPIGCIQMSGLAAPLPPSSVR